MFYTEAFRTLTAKRIFVGQLHNACRISIRKTCFEPKFLWRKHVFHALQSLKWVELSGSRVVLWAEEYWKKMKKFLDMTSNTSQTHCPDMMSQKDSFVYFSFSFHKANGVLASTGVQLINTVESRLFCSPGTWTWIDLFLLLFFLFFYLKFGFDRHPVGVQCLCFFVFQRRKKTMSRRDWRERGRESGRRWRREVRPSRFSTSTTNATI